MNHGLVFSKQTPELIAAIPFKDSLRKILRRHGTGVKSGYLDCGDGLAFARLGYHNLNGNVQFIV
jgi:hypothetical protein